MHNTRIERIWVDVTSGFGKKWHEFFDDLEANYGLDVENLQLLWLLHHLFLHLINEDALRWAEAWNCHKLQMRGEPDKSPQEMFFFSMLEDGPRGFEDSLQGGDDEDVGDPAALGIDWEAIADPELMEHHRLHNPQETHEDTELTADINPFHSTPIRLSEVLCESPNCPFDEAQLARFDAELRRNVDVNSSSMLVRLQIWLHAIRIASDIHDGPI